MKRKTRIVYPRAKEGGVMKNVLVVLMVGLVVIVGVTIFGNAGISADEVKNANTGKVEVVVQDASDQPIAKATVQVASQDTNKTTKLTNKNGTYSGSVAAGRYTIEASASSYDSTTLYTIVKSGETQKLTIHLSK